MSELIDPRQQGPDEAGFTEIVRLIGASRDRAMQAVNTALIDLYWQIGEIISRRVAAAQWGDGAVDQLASYIARWEPGIRGFSRSNLLRMRQFYETYRDDQIVAPLVRQIPWSHHLQILGQCKLPEEREFYLRLTVREGWSKRPVVLTYGKNIKSAASLNPETLRGFNTARVQATRSQYARHFPLSSVVPSPDRPSRTPFPAIREAG